MIIEADDEELRLMVITTKAKFVKEIQEFTRKNYGPLVLEDLNFMIGGADKLKIHWAYNAVGTDVLIRFIAELELADQ